MNSSKRVSHFYHLHKNEIQTLHNATKTTVLALTKHFAFPSLMKTANLIHIKILSQ